MLRIENAETLNELDLEEKEDNKLAINFVSFDFKNPTIAQNDISISFTLPKTQKNLKEIGYVNNISSDSVYPYVENKYNIYRDSVVIMTNAIIYIESVSDVININILGRIKDFFTQIQDKNLQDLDMSAYNHAFNRATIEASHNNTYQDGYVYDLIHRGLKNESQSRRWSEQRASIFVKPIIDKIFEEAGYIIEGFDEPEIEDLILPFSNKDVIPFDQDAIDLGDLKNVKATSEELQYFTNGFPAEVFECTTLNGLGYDNGGGNLFDNVNYEYNADGDYLIDIKVNFILYVTTQVRAYLYIDNQRAGDGQNDYPPLIFNFVGNNIPQEQYFNDISVSDGQTIEIRVEGVGGLVANQSGLKAGSYVEYLAKYTIPQNAQWDVAVNLPDMNQKDFLKSIFLLYGYLVDSKNIEKKVIASKSTQIIANKINAPDWSKYIDAELSRTRMRLSFRYIENVYRNNYIFWKNNDIDNDKTYSALTQISDVFLPDKGVIATLPYEYTEKDSLGVPVIQMFEPNNNDAYRFEDHKRNNIKPRILKKTNNTQEYILLNEDYVEYKVIDIIQTSTMSVSDVLDLQEYYDNHWALYNKMTQNPKVVKLIARIKESTISTFDKAIPIYLDVYVGDVHINGYFFITKIEQYISSKYPLELVLVRI